MLDQDSIDLLRECSAGIKMGVASIDGAMPAVRSKTLLSIMGEYKTAHERLGRIVDAQLRKAGGHGHSPHPAAKAMSQLKTAVKLTIDKSDSAVADLMTDGCNMGVKSLNKYLNTYSSADECAKHLTLGVINLEKRFATDIRTFL